MHPTASLLALHGCTIRSRKIRANPASNKHALEDVIILRPNQRERLEIAMRGSSDAYWMMPSIGFAKLFRDMPQIEWEEVPDWAWNQLPARTLEAFLYAP